MRKTTDLLTSYGRIVLANVGRAPLAWDAGQVLGWGRQGALLEISGA